MYDGLFPRVAMTYVGPAGATLTAEQTPDVPAGATMTAEQTPDAPASAISTVEQTLSVPAGRALIIESQSAHQALIGALRLKAYDATPAP